MSLMPFETARARLLNGIAPRHRHETVDLRQAAGRVLAADIRATRTQPPFDASAMDGYAVCNHGIAPGTSLQLIGESAAGTGFEGRLLEGQAVRILTGAPLPEGADTVIIQENTQVLTANVVMINDTPVSGQHIRKAGNDFSAGDVVLKAGQRLTAGAVAIAASAGHPSLKVLQRPLVAVLATGDELVLPGQPAGPAQIFASNQFGLAALIEANGGVVLDLGIAPDSVAEINARLDRAQTAGADIIVTIGGASVGDRDLVAPCLESRGIRLDFWKVAMRPGKPLMAARDGSTHILGLPGNPASTMVAATLFLRPLLRQLAGLPAETAFLDGVLAAPVKPNGIRADFQRARIGFEAGAYRVEPLPRQDSSLLSIYAAANGLLYRPVDAPAAAEDTPCQFVWLD